MALRLVLKSWTYNEKYDSVPAPFVYNVSHPTLTAYLPGILQLPQALRLYYVPVAAFSF